MTAATLTVAHSEPAKAPAVSHFTLPNGLEVVVIPDHRAPVVTHMLWYRVGSADETPGKSGLAHFLEHLMFKGTAKNPAGFSPSGRDHRRPGERLHVERLHRLLPAGAARQAQVDDGVRGRPHDRPRPHRRRGQARAQRRARRAQHARRQQSGRAPGRADGSGALPQSSLRPSGDRLAPGDRAAQSPGCARLLSPLLHAQQRRAGRRRRRDARGSQEARRRDLRQGAARRPRSPPRVRPQEPRSVGAAHRDARRSARDAAEPAALLPRAQRRQARRERSARSARAHSRPRRQQPALQDAGGRSGPGGERRRRATTAPRSIRPALRSMARRSPARPCRSSKPRSTQSSPTSSPRASRRTNSSAPRTG